MPLRQKEIFFWQSVGQKQDRSGKHQSIGEVVQAIADVRRNGDQDREVNNEDYKKNCEAQISRREAGFFVEEEACAGGEEDNARKIGPEKAERNPIGRDFCEGDAGGVLRMEKVFNAEKDGCDGDNVASESHQERRCVFGLQLSLSARESESAAAEREIP